MTPSKMRHAVLFALGVVAVALLVRAPTPSVAASPMTVSAHNRAALTCNAATLNGKYAFYRTGMTVSAATVVGAVGFQYYFGNSVMQAVQWTNKNGAVTANPPVLGLYLVNSDCSFQLWSVKGTLPPPCGNPISGGGGRRGGCNISDITPYEDQLMSYGVIGGQAEELFLVSVVNPQNPVVNLVAKLIP